MKKSISIMLVAAIIMAATAVPAEHSVVAADAGQTLFINEVMAANTVTLRDGDTDDPKDGSKGGAYSDWIELYNGGTSPVSLTGYTISDDGATWTFPQGTVPAKGYILVWASDKNKVAPDGQLHTNFKISSSGETITLKGPDGAVIDSVTTVSLGDDQSYGRKSDGAEELTVLSKATPKSANIYNPGPAVKTLFINEVMATNTVTLRDGDTDDPKDGSKGGAYSDWIELYNGGTSPVSLTGYTISDDGATWTFPQGTVPAKGYILVWASDKNKVAPDGQLHTNFKISSSGETITLKGPDGAVIDSVTTVSLEDDQAYGRESDGSEELTVLSKATPKSANIYSPAPTAVAMPVFSHEAGFYTQAFSLQLSTPETGVRIYYTTDGSDPAPGASGTYEYTGSINIKSRAGDPNVLSMISNTTSPFGFGLTWKAPKGEVFKCSMVKAVAVRNDGTKSKIATKSYFVDPNMNTRYSLPVISIVTDRKNFFDNATGIYVNNNYLNKGEEWERPIHIEFFEKDGTLGFSQYAGVRINGNYTRNFPQKSLRLYAEGYDDADKFKYDIFPGLTKKVSGKSLKSFSTLVLRNSGNDWQYTMFRDAMISSLVSQLNVATVAYRPSVVFLDGEYWGIHNIRERMDGEYFESHYNIDKKNLVLMDVIQQAGEGFEMQEGTDEDAASYTNDITNYLKSNSITNPDVYNNIKTKMDIDNFIDYEVSEIYCANTDWPGNNVSLWKFKTEDGKYHPEAPYGQDGRWRWVLRDTDYGFGMPASGGQVNDNSLEYATSDTVSFAKWPWSVFLFKTLLQNTEFRNAFINRFADYLNTIFTSSRVNGRIDEMKAVIASSIPEHNDRWQAIGNWNNEVQTMKTFASGRPATVRQNIITKFRSSGVTGTYQVKLNTDTAKGYIKINSVDIKTSTPGVTTPAAWTGTYFKSVPVTLKATPEEGYKFDHWEGVTGVAQTSDTITFTPDSDVNITAVFATDEPAGFKVSGYVNPDLSSMSASIKSGFKVEIEGQNISAVTDSNGYFELKAVPSNTSGYTVKISKDNYLYREFKNVTVTSDKVLAAQSAPIAMWAGDILINGVQDGAINMSDIMEIAKAFNTAPGDVRYNANGDSNADNTVNMSDVMITAKHFNTSTSSY